jgi:hypothetical protein
MIDSFAHIQVRPRPPAAGLAEPPILNIPRRHTLCFQSITNGSKLMKVREVRSPAAAVYENHDRMGATPWRHSQLAKLVDLFAISNAIIRQLRRQCLKLPWRHEIARGLCQATTA